MRILLVDAAGPSRATTASWLEMLRGDPAVEVTASGAEALALLGNGKPLQFVLVDSQLADMNVFEFVRQAKAHVSAPKVVMIARILTEHLLASARAAGADHGIEKSRLQRELPPLLYPG
ncbi:MAG TPA: response regulator [Burkholderiales bacterium]|nr:response regulator [Burkholderiales bacterium]